jgi:hypothetical protein
MLVLHSFSFRCIPSACIGNIVKNTAFQAIIDRNAADCIGTNKNGFPGTPAGTPRLNYEDDGYMA